MRAITCWAGRWTLPLAATAGLMAGSSVLAAPAQGQVGTLEGTVTAVTSGLPIARAQISLVGTNIGVRTDENGEFILINLPSGRHEIEILAIGYSQGSLEFTVQAGQTTEVEVSLRKTVLRLDEVVVTGTPGFARRREVGNSISQIDVAAVADPPQNVEQLLQARAPGVNVSQGSGMAGSGGQIRLRGAVSVSQSNQPLIYIDGIRVENRGYLKNVPPVGYDGRSGNVAASPLNDINPADIDRVEIIKGAAASTLYGTDASAGVIQIFTKRGARGRPSWTFQIDQGFSNLRPFGTETNPYLNLKPCFGAVTCADIWESDEVEGSCADENSTNQCSWIRNGWRQRYSGSVSGGTGPFSYFMSGSFEDNDAPLPQDNEKRVVGRGNFGVDLFDNVRFEFNTQYSNNRIQNTAAGNNAHGLTLNVYRAEQNYLQSLEPAGLRDLLNQEITTEIDRLITGGTVTYTPWPSFTNRFTLGYDFANQENRNLRPFGFVRAPTGILSDQQVRLTTLTADYAGSFTFDITDDIGSNFSFGGQSVTREVVSTVAYGDDFPGPGDPTVSNAATFISRESRERIVTAGFFFQDVISFYDKVFLTAGVRFDGNSAFGSSLGLEAYPKFQGSYVISDEAFWPTSVISEMKLRAAVGWAGRAPGAFDAERTWDPQASNFQPAFLPENIGNDSLGPERTREIEFGVEAGWLNNRISTDFTWYHQRTSDALFFVRQLPTGGFTAAQLENVGVIRNAGIELGINGIVIDGADWGLDIGANIYTNHSLVIDLGDAVPFAAGGGWVEAGHPVMAARGTKILRPHAVEDIEECALDGSNAATCNVARDQIFGPQQPTEVIGFNASIRFPKNVTLSARGEYQGGAYIFDGPTNNALSRSVRWPTCEAAYPLIDAGRESELTLRQRIECIADNHIGSIHYYKQDFFKLRDISLTIPMQWAIPQVSSAFLTLSAQNWIRWINSDLRMFDPEMTDNGGRERSGLDDQNRSITEHIPPPAVFTASLRISF